MGAIIEQTKKELDRACQRLEHLFELTPEDRINWSPSPTSRTPVQQIIHSAISLEGIQKMLSGGVFPYESTGEADADWRVMEKQVTSRVQALAMLYQNASNYKNWLDSLTSEQLASTAKLPFGEVPFSFAITFGVMHTQNHIAQLEYIQTIYGDHDWHQ